MEAWDRQRTTRDGKPAPRARPKASVRARIGPPLFALGAARSWVIFASALRFLEQSSCAAQAAGRERGLWENIFGKQSFTMTGKSMSGTDPRVELSREFFGAVIALTGVTFQWWQNRKLRD